MFFKTKPKPQHYQYYANVNPNACVDCLARHGELFTDLIQVPPAHEGCRCSILPVAPDKLKEARQQRERMRTKAHGELERRELFDAALRLLDEDLSRALDCLKASVEIDIFIEELELLNQRYRYLLDRDPELVRTLRKLFVNAYFKKMDQLKYQTISPGMYGQLETQGRKLIQSMFADSPSR